MLSRKNERKRKLRKIQDESTKNNSKQKENHIYRIMTPCGRIKKTNNHVCAFKQKITFKLHLKCSVGNIWKWIKGYYREKNKVSTVRSLFSTQFLKKRILFFSRRCRLDSSKEYGLSGCFCLIVGKSWPTAAGIAFVHLWWKKSFQDLVVCFGIIA